MVTRDELHQHIIDTAIDYTVEDVEYDNQAEKSALLDYLKRNYATGEEQEELRTFLDEMQLGAATFMDGWVAALKAIKKKKL